MPTYATSTVAAPMPNLENLRKQAKLVLRWHRDRYYPVAAQIRSGLPRFSRMTDREILAQSFKLSDAQELVARQHGFESWQALKTGLPAMPDQHDNSVTKAVITSVEPELFVADIKTSCDFFTGKLGFAVAFTYGEPPFYAQVRRDGAAAPAAARRLTAAHRPGILIALHVGRIGVTPKGQCPPTRHQP